MMELFNLVLKGDVIVGEAQAGEASKQNHKPSESRESSMNRALEDDVIIVGEAAQVGETSKENRNPSDSRQSSMNRALRGHVIIVGEAAHVGETSKQNRNPKSTGGRNVKSIVQFYERCNSGSKTTKEEGEQDFDSTMQLVRRSPRQKPSVPCFQQHPVTPPTSAILVDAAAKSAAPPPEEATSDASTKDIQQGNRRVKRKISSNVHKEITQAVENASKLLAESIDRIHSTNLQVAENKVKSQEHLFNTELDYMKKRDRQVNRNQKNLISAINGLTKIIMTGLKNTASAGDAIQLENACGGDIDIEATGQDTLQTVDKTTQQAADAQEQDS